MQFSSIQSTDRALSGATVPGQSGPGSDGNEGVLHIPQSSSITGTSPSDCLVSFPGHSLGAGSYRSTELHSLYSTAPHPQLTGQTGNIILCQIHHIHLIFHPPITIFLKHLDMFSCQKIFHYKGDIKTAFEGFLA